MIINSYIIPYILIYVHEIGGWSAETGRKQDEALGTRPAHQ
jgi:hypothetical protein